MNVQIGHIAGASFVIQKIKHSCVPFEVTKHFLESTTISGFQKIFSDAFLCIQNILKTEKHC